MGTAATLPDQISEQKDCLHIAFWGSGSLQAKFPFLSRPDTFVAEPPHGAFPVSPGWEIAWEDNFRSCRLSLDAIVLDPDCQSLGDLTCALEAAFYCLRSGGRLIVLRPKDRSGPATLQLRRRLHFAGFTRQDWHDTTWQRRLPVSPAVVATKPRVFSEPVSALSADDQFRPARILHLAGATWHCAWVMEQLRELGKLGHSVEAAISGPGPLADNLQKAGIKYEFHYLEFAWGLFTVPDFMRGVYALARHFYKKRYEVVQYHLFHSSIIGRFAAWIADVPVRVTMSPSPYYMGAPASRLIERKTAWMDTAILATGRGIFELYAQNGVPERLLNLIRYGDDPLKFDPGKVDHARVRGELAAAYGFHPTAPLVTRVSYFYPPLPDNQFAPEDLRGRSLKDHESLIAAAPKILSNFPEARILLPGSGAGLEGEQYLEGLKAQVEAMGLADKILFLGFRTDAQHILGASDVAVVCSFNHENDGGAKEALLMGTAVVATSCGCISDYVKHEVTGLLVPPGTPDALADAIIRLLADKDLARQSSVRGRAFMIRQFSLTTTVDQLSALYQSQLAGSAPLFGRRGYNFLITAWRALLLPFIILNYGRTIYWEDFRTCYWSNWTNRAKWFFLDPYYKWRDLRRKALSSSGWLGTLNRLALTGPVRACKRLLDIIACLILIPATLPVWFAARLSDQPVKIFTALSRRGTPFHFAAWCLPQSLRPQFQESDGSRHSVLFTTLWWVPLLPSVLKGDMSFVGPRLRPPEAPEQDFSLAHLMDPGITGWSQVNWCKRLDAREQDLYDALYVATWGLLLDLKILLKPMWMHLKGRAAASNRGEAQDK